MRQMNVSGQIESVGLRDGSSGRFLGDIEGLYEGYRVGNPEEQEGVLSLANGTLAVVVRHVSPLGRLRGENPFRSGRDVFANPPPGGPTAGAPSGQGPHGEAPAGGPTGGAPPIRKKRFVTLSIDGSKCTGIFAGASGEVELITPRHRESGYVVVDTVNGELRMNFVEWREEPHLIAEFTVDGDKSTGTYHQARGELKAKFVSFPGAMGKATYSGTLVLEREPPRT